MKVKMPDMSEPLAIENPVIGYVSVVVTGELTTSTLFFTAEVLATVVERANRSREVEYFEYVGDVYLCVDKALWRYVKIDPYKMGSRLKAHIDARVKELALEEANKQKFEQWHWY